MFRKSRKQRIVLRFFDEARPRRAFLQHRKKRSMTQSIFAARQIEHSAQGTETAIDAGVAQSLRLLVRNELAKQFAINVLDATAGKEFVETSDSVQFWLCFSIMEKRFSIVDFVV